MNALLCSECFRDSGLKFEARRLGRSSSLPCPNCQSVNGAKLNRRVLLYLRDRFFRHATAPHGIGGYHVPILEINDADAPDDEIEMRQATRLDWRLIKEKVGGRIFYNAPALWKVGITEHYDDNGEIAPTTIDAIVDRLSVKTIGPQDEFFRIRRNVPSSRIHDPMQYDTPPSKEGKVDYYRFDDRLNSLLYASPSVAVCLHECRVVLTDNIYVATLAPTQSMQLADLTADYKQEPRTPFEDLTHFFNGLVFSAETYETCRTVAKPCPG